MLLNINDAIFDHSEDSRRHLAEMGIVFIQVRGGGLSLRLYSSSKFPLFLGFVCYVVINPCVLSVNRVDFFDPPPLTPVIPSHFQRVSFNRFLGDAENEDAFIAILDAMRMLSRLGMNGGIWCPFDMNFLLFSLFDLFL